MDNQGLELLPPNWRIPEMVAAREVPGHGLCIVQHFMVTAGLCTRVRFDHMSIDYDRRYCFDIGPEAAKALFAWDGAGDPPGAWLKEKVSNRWRVPREDP